MEEQGIVDGRKPWTDVKGEQGVVAAECDYGRADGRGKGELLGGERRRNRWRLYGAGAIRNVEFAANPNTGWLSVGRRRGL